MLTSLQLYLYILEQLAPSLFCMHASQSDKISLWRTVPVWLYPFWDMTVFIRQDYSQYDMLWGNNNKVHRFFVFLLCCSFESFTLFWLVQRMYYHWLSMSPSLWKDLKRLILVKWPLPSLLNRYHGCFSWSFLKVNLSNHHIWESNTRCFLVFDT